MSERINYVISNGRYCWHSVNMPLVGESESFEEMQEDVRILTEAWMNGIKETLKENLFEYKEEEPFKKGGASKAIQELKKITGGYWDKFNTNEEINAELGRDEQHPT